ncbi:hypothetical protein AVU99_gp076 [Mycobacterium phage Lolly9]|uniref:Uncharacterized protein n=1 Tax=Mycobacterium phage Lolly9 TaxID=1698711 RepID=A0A0K2FN33_9CAUD|nr:hypothetical protein AVU99_gp076 [Mycobacterium phage Lolly9]ALA48521.1 hypothetical protein LOLLY9_110 [Mycobacterium phage Lolly9]QOP65832.1 hypothetical protein PBI_MINILON_115 [Mycobacterium phage MiniLon]QOP66578.1 hypothetical protein PBI_MINIMAC_115 [Mycobacterium phage MiniMac]
MTFMILVVAADGMLQRTATLDGSATQSEIDDVVLSLLDEFNGQAGALLIKASSEEQITVNDQTFTVTTDRWVPDVTDVHGSLSALIAR